MSARDMQRNRAQRYREGFNITRKMSNPEEAYKNLIMYAKSIKCRQEICKETELRDTEKGSILQER